MTRLLGLGLVLALATLASPAEAQLLRRASGAARGDDDRGSSSSGSSSWPSSRDRDDDDDDYDDDDYDYDYDQGSGGSLLGRASGVARGGSGWSSGSYGDGSYPDDRGSLLGGASRVGRGGGAPYPGPARPREIGYQVSGCPYAGDRPGLGAVAQPGEGWSVAGRLTVEGGWAIGGAARTGAAARVQIPGVNLDLSARYSFFFEPTDEGLVALALGRWALEYRILQTPYVQLRVGLAARHMHDDLGSIGGGDLSLAIDVFPGEPVVVAAEGAVGVVGEAVYVQARGELGVMVDSTELYAGYDYEGLFAAGQHVDLGGPMAGVRLWL